MTIRQHYNPILLIYNALVCFGHVTVISKAKQTRAKINESVGAKSATV
jgi:hypothetical protein